MTYAAFAITGDQATLIANDVTDFRYRAAVQVVPVGVQIPVRTNLLAETQIMIEQGSLEVMVGGLVAPAGSGEYLRVAPGVAYAWRNVGKVPARLLIRCSSPNKSCKRPLHIRLEVAA